MATNEVYRPGWHLSVACDSPATPASGNPVRYGKLSGIALTDEGEGGNDATKTSVYFGPGIYDVVVDDNEGAGIAAGDPIYYHDTGTGTGAVHLNNSATGFDAFFGIALEPVSANATTLINVMHIPVGANVSLANNAVGTAQVATDAITYAKLGTDVTNDVEGNGVMQVARAELDATGVVGDRTIAAHASGVVLPDNAIVVGGFVDVITTFTSATDAATIAISVQGANDIVSALAISNGANIWDAGLHPIIPKANTPETTGIKLTANRDITYTVAVEALTAGKAVLYLYYVNGA